MSIIDIVTPQDFKTQFPRFTPQYLTDIEYQADKTYFPNNVVYYENQFYIANKQTTELPTNTEDWALYDDSVLNYTQDSDIINAFNEAYVNFNEKLFKNNSQKMMIFLYLTAHYLTNDFMTALGMNNLGIPTSKSVGSVSEGYTIPQWLTNSNALSVYATTPYGVKYASLIRPYLIGNIFLLKGRTTTA